MNKLMMVILTLTSQYSYADCTERQSDEVLEQSVLTNTDVPNYLKGATITVTLVDGKSSTVPAELFKVVPRKQQRIVTKVNTTRLVSCTQPQENNQRNRISVLAGHGTKQGLSSSTNGTTVEVESKVGFVAGVQYQRQLGLKLFGLPVSVGVQGQTNKTGLGIVGLDF